jgi:predicted metal-dependent hydrolase
MYAYQYLLFLYYFNIKRDYYECHDVMEDLWLEQQRDRFLQGLLQIAVGLYHFKWHNIPGAILLFEGAVEKLEPYPEVKEGIHLGKIREEANHYLIKLSSYEAQPFSYYDLSIEIIDPELQEMVDGIGK